MCKVVVISVNYNSDEAGLQFVSSLTKSSAASEVDVSLVLVDNTERDSSGLFFERVHAYNPDVVCIKAPKNVGYFNGARLGFNEYLQTNTLPEWVMVSNVDLEINDVGFFQNLLILCGTEGTEDIGVVAPSIWSNVSKRDLNPYCYYKTSQKMMHLYRVIYRSYYTYNLFVLLSIIKSGIRRIFCTKKSGDRMLTSERTLTSQQDIYAPHGACLLFSKLYFERGGTLNYPMFLYGEEFFVAETAKKLGLRIVYDPRLRMISNDHVSTGRFPRSRQIASYHYESTVFVVDAYFR
jgi:GT2 family glycosyltransferase